MCRAVGTLRDARAAFDAFRGIHRIFLDDLGNRNRVGFRGAAGVDGDEAAGLNDFVEGTAIDDQILDHREGTRAPRFDPDRVAILEMPHVQLTGRRSAERPVRDAVDHHAARSADAFAAVVLEVNRFLALLDEPFVDHVEHLQEGGVG